MSILLFAKVVPPRTLAEVFADMEQLVPPGARVAPRLAAGGDPASVVLASFPVAEHERDGRRYKDDVTSWDRGGVDVAMGPVAKVELTFEYVASIAELEVGTYEWTEADRRQDRRASGYRVVVDAGILRTKASFCLAVLLATAVARRSGALIQDESGHLTGEEWVDPSIVLARFARHADAPSFEAFADAFCKDIDFASSWPDSVTLVDDGAWRA